MDLAACGKNVTGCLASFGLKICDKDKDICLERGLCITTIIPSNISICMCYTCYYGDRCEKELFSKNLGLIGLASPSLSSNIIFALKFLPLFFSIIQLINSLLCLQTYLSSKRIRITNMGVYLIFNASISLLLAVMLFIQSILSWVFKNIPDNYWTISCYIDRKFVYIAFTYMWGWSVFFIAFERVLIQCYHYSLYDSRKRSLIILILVFIICSLTTIPGIFTLKNLPTDQLNLLTRSILLPTSCINYTSLGYIIDKIILRIHTYGTLLCYVILCFVVFVHMMKHRKGIAPNSTTLQNIRLVLWNHRDFFIPLVFSIICSTPAIVLYETMTCSKAFESKSFPYLMLVFGFSLVFLPASLSFFTYVYPANVYRVAFWRKSWVGNGLMYLKNQIVNMRNSFLTCLQRLQRPHPQSPTIEMEQY